VADPKIKTHLSSLGVIPKSMTPLEFGKLIASETQRYGDAIRKLGIKAE